MRITLKTLHSSSQKMRIAIWLLTFGYATLAISLILLVRGNPELVLGI